MLKNIGLNLSSLNYYISRSQNRPNIIKEFSDIAMKHNLDGLEFYPSSFVKKGDHYKLDKIYRNLDLNGLFYILDCAIFINDLRFDESFYIKKVF